MTAISSSTAHDKVQQWRSWLALSLLLFVLSWLLALAYPVDELGKRANDLYFRLHHDNSPSSQVALVVVDDASLSRYGRWPWPRTRLAQLIRAIHSQHPRAIGIDILLSEPEDEQNDSALAESIRDAGNVVLVDKIAGSPGGQLWVEPLRRFAAAAAGVGHVQVALDADGICRSVPARELSVDDPRSAFVLEVARVASERPAQVAGEARFIEKKLRPASAGIGQQLSGIDTESPRLLVINYRPQIATDSPNVARSFPVISAAGILSGDGGDELRSKVVLVGFASTGLTDELLTPVTTRSPMPGVEIHANLLDSLLSGTSLNAVGNAAQTLALLASSCLLGGLALRGGVVSSLGPLGLAVIEYTSGYLLFSRAHLQLSLGPLLCSTILAAPFGQIWNLVLVNRSLNRSFRILQHELQGGPAMRPQVGMLTRETDAAGGKKLSWKLELLTRIHAQLSSLYVFHQTLLNSMQEGLVVLAPDGTFLFFNRSWETFCELYGCDSARALRLLDVVCDSTQWRQMREAGTEVLGQFETEAHIGNGFWHIQVQRLPWTSHAGSTALMIILANRTATMERDRARAEALNFVTHELRTPLVSIQGFAELLERFPQRARTSESAGVIFRESRRLVAMIDTYLDVLRLDSGHHVPRQDPIDVKQMLTDVIQVVRPWADTSNLTIECEYSEGELSVRGDPPLLAGAMLNLLSNAIKYSPEGTGVRVRVVQKAATLAFEVWNHGPSLPEDQLEELFQPFYRGPGDHTSKRGWGLGLAFVKRIAEKHSGSVDVYNDGVRGTCFALVLPNEKVAQGAVP
jgi:signal transduction histidine kinase/CHASE2 domain-containing sensor protein